MSPLTHGDADRQFPVVQRVPPTPDQRGVIELLYTAEVLRRRILLVLADYRISLSQYNVLRILRGAEGGPLTAATITERLIEPTQGISALLDRMEGLGWVARVPDDTGTASTAFRMTHHGLAMLQRVDPAIEASAQEQMAPLDRDQRGTLAELLARLRSV
jgi:DNA-binding MarR family transcriptional regulator